MVSLLKITTCGDSNDYELAKELHKLLDEADFMVAHNLKQYDFKVANTRFAAHGLPPISPTKLIDTLEIAKKNFRFPDNKLNTTTTLYSYQSGIGANTEAILNRTLRHILYEDLYGNGGGGGGPNGGNGGG